MIAPSRSAQLRGLDDVPPHVARVILRPVCASERWIAAVVAGRPYSELPALVAASDAALAELSWADVEEALAAHPRIGDRASGADREAAWSRQEQSAAAGGDTSVRVELRAANVAYEDRFGWVFLICASGRSAPEILDAARERLGNDVPTEQAAVRAELRDIVRLRLGKAFAPEAAEEPADTARMSLSTHVLDAVTGRPAAGMAVSLECRDGDSWLPVADGVTDSDGRVKEVANDLGPGVCRLVFDVDGWSGRAGGAAAFYPEVVLTFRVTADDRHLHVPLLLSPFSYSTYRGS